MSKILTIVQREYTTRVRRRLFIITTLLLPLFFILISVVPALMATYSSESYKIAVVDESGIFKNDFTDHKNVFYKSIDSPFAEVKKTYKGIYSGILHIPQGFDIYHPSGILLYSDKQIGLNVQQTISDDLTQTVRIKKLAYMHIAADSLTQADKSISFESIIAGENGDEQKGNTEVATALGYIMGFFIYIVMFVYGTMVLRGVMEEKTNRISEVIISSVKPFELMMGKIIGVGLVGLTQFFIWIILAWGGLAGLGVFFHDQLANAHSTGMMAQNSAVQNTHVYDTVIAAIHALPIVKITFCFVFYFLGGYLFYSALFAAIGSAAGDDPGETQSLNFIVTLPILCSFFIMLNVLQNPNSTLALVTSFIPFCTPLIMSARLSFGVPDWQIAASMVSLILGFIFTTWLAGKIYRTGILMYGKKVTIKELGKWLFYKN